MRLGETAIMSGLQHPSVFVRERVLQHLEDCFRTEPDATRLVCDAIRVFGWKDAFLYPHRLASFAVDQNEAAWILAECDRREEDGGPTNNTRMHLVRCLAAAPVEVIAPHAARVEGLEESLEALVQFVPRDRAESSRLSLRIELAGATPEECWTRLHDHCRRVARVETFAEADIPYGEALVERIAQGGELFADEVQTILRREPRESGDFDDWLVGFAIELAGLLRLAGAAELVYRQFAVDWDWYNEEISKTLRRIGGAQTAGLLCRQYGEAPEHVQIYSSGVLEAIHYDGAADAIAKLVPHETDPNFRVQLGIAMASHFDTAGFEPALAIAREHSDDPERGQIIESLFAHAKLAGLDSYADLCAQWETELTEDSQRTLQATESLAALWSEAGSVRSRGPEKETRFNDDEFLDGPFLASGATIIKESPHVGRNAACPCGSGKKYKKCCGGASRGVT